VTAAPENRDAAQLQVQRFARAGARLSRGMNALPDMPPLLTSGEAGRLLRISPSTIRRWIGSGRIEAVRTDPRRGGRWLLRTADLLKLLGLDEQPAVPAPPTPNASEVR
jgi:excisionase family DNA binding protein